MAAALVLAAGLRVARRVVAVAGPRGAQVRSGRGGEEGVLRALTSSGARGPRSSSAPPGARSPAASRGPSPRLKLQGCAVRWDWWSRQPLRKPRRERSELAMSDALHRPGPRGRTRVHAEAAAFS